MTAIALALGLASAFGLVYAFFRLSPWPSALRVRRRFDKDGVAVNAKLAKHVPAGVNELRNEHYDLTDRDAWLDVYFPESVDAERGQPTIVWVHGGGWLAGSKNQVENYARILASQGYTVITVDYSLAPGKKYPTPVRQLARALAYVEENAQRFGADASRLVLAGDSAGAQIAAQMANLLRVPDYAAALTIAPPIERSSVAGVLLFCGRYDAKSPPFGGVAETMLWAYSGTKDYVTEPAFATFSVLEFVTRDFPPAFITSGNGDSHNKQSIALAEALRAVGAPVDALFFPDDHSPRLPHEYQFNLDSDAGRLALERTLLFLSRCAGDAADAAMAAVSS